MQLAAADDPYVLVSIEHQDSFVSVNARTHRSPVLLQSRVPTTPPMLPPLAASLLDMSGRESAACAGSAFLLRRPTEVISETVAHQSGLRNGAST